MTTSIDTNVIVALWDADEKTHRAARGALEQAQEHGGLVICGTVYAELRAAPGRSEAFLDRFCEETSMLVEWSLAEEAWRVAGTAFQDYAERRRKGKGVEARRLLADFLIGAHALVNGYVLLTLDAGIYRAAFPRLAIQRV